VKRNLLGEAGEKLAAAFLKQKGYHILQTNFRCRAGEIDIVAEQAGDLVFIEVRSKSNSNFGSPEESLTGQKKAHLEAAVETYLQRLPQPPQNWRVDLVAVELDQRQKLRRIELLENVLEE
jgi:putative endonuclease